MTVSGWTRISADRQSRQVDDSRAHRNRSEAVSFGRLTDRCRTPSWWRSARISSCRAARLRKEAKSAVKRADNRCPQGNRRKRDNFQCINQIRFCENYSRVFDRLSARWGAHESKPLFKGNPTVEIVTWRAPIPSPSLAPESASASRRLSRLLMKFFLSRRN